MGRVVLRFSMSLDGFVAGPDVGVEQPMGAGGERLHSWMFNGEAGRGPDADILQEMFASVGAVVLGRRTFEVGLKQWGDTPYPVPSFVLTHQQRGTLAMKSAAFTFVADGIESAVRQAKAAAGEKDIVVMGANTAQQAINAGLADDIQIQLVPVLFGAGTRLFGEIWPEQLELSRTRLVASPFVTHFTFQRAAQATSAA